MIVFADELDRIFFLINVYEFFLLSWQQIDAVGEFFLFSIEVVVKIVKMFLAGDDDFILFFFQLSTEFMELEFDIVRGF